MLRAMLVGLAAVGVSESDVDRLVVNSAHAHLVDASGVAPAVLVYNWQVIGAVVVSHVFS